MHRIFKTSIRVLQIGGFFTPSGLLPSADTDADLTCHKVSLLPSVQQAPRWSNKRWPGCPSASCTKIQISSQTLTENAFIAFGDIEKRERKTRYWASSMHRWSQICNAPSIRPLPVPTYRIDFAESWHIHFMYYYLTVKDFQYVKKVYLSAFSRRCWRLLVSIKNRIKSHLGCEEEETPEYQIRKWAQRVESAPHWES